MGTLAAAPVLPSKLKQSSLFLYRKGLKRKNLAIVPVARLFVPAMFDSSKLNVLVLPGGEEKHPGKLPMLPRVYTFTHSDITSKLTLAISQTINYSQFQGWYNRLQRDEVVAEWKKVKGKMSLHVHCHISGDHFLLDWFAWLRYFIFCKELPVVLKAFVHGDVELFNNYPELQEAPVYVYFHSNIPEFKKEGCWGPVNAAAAPTSWGGGGGEVQVDKMPEPCQEDCSCCFPLLSLIQWPAELPHENEDTFGAQQQQQSVQQQTR